LASKTVFVYKVLAAFLPFLPAPTDPTCFKSDIVILKQFTDTNLLTHIPHFPQNHT